MTDEEFDAYLEEALDELEAKQNYLENEFGLGSHNQFSLGSENGELSFVSNGQVIVTFAITEIGSHVPEKESWQWAWANNSLPEKVREKAARLQQLYDITGFDVFKQPAATFDQTMAWECVALSCRALGTMGAYSMPQRQLRRYVLLDSVLKKA